MTGPRMTAPVDASSAEEKRRLDDALAEGLEEKDRPCARYIQGFDSGRHRNANRADAAPFNFRKSLAFVPEQNCRGFRQIYF